MASSLQFYSSTYLYNIIRMFLNLCVCVCVFSLQGWCSLQLGGGTRLSLKPCTQRERHEELHGHT